MMKSVFILSLMMTTISGCSHSQKTETGPYDPQLSFVALMVTEIDTAISWYMENLGFTLLNRVDNQQRGFSQANLKKGGIMLELIETQTTLSQKALLTDYPVRTRIAGIFKVGFTVTDFDGWIQHLTSAQVNFRGDVVVDQESGKRMVIILDPDGNRIQLFER